MPIGNMWFIMFMARGFEGEQFGTFKAPQGGLFGGIGRKDKEVYKKEVRYDSGNRDS